MGRSQSNKVHDRWQAVVNRTEPPEDFVYAVITTGIYCRPSCPSRRPKHVNVLFFDGPQAAEMAGFRPCRRCRPDQRPGDDCAERIARYGGARQAS